MRLPVLTERDRTLIQKIDDYGFLSTRQVQDLCFKEIDVRTVLRRLRILERRKLIHRITGLKGGALAWGLTSNGQRIAGSSAVQLKTNKNALEHDLLFNAIRLKLEGEGMRADWKSGHWLRQLAVQNKAPHLRGLDVIPDGVFSFTKNGKAFTIAVELELFAKSKRRYRKILELYGQKDIMLLWYWVPNRKLGELVAGEWKSIYDCRKGNSFVAWSTIDELFGDPKQIQLRTKEKILWLKYMFDLDKKDPVNGQILPAHVDAHGVGGKAENAQIASSSNS